MNSSIQTHQLHTQVGYAGLTPFYGLAISTLMVSEVALRNLLLNAQAAYAGLIASFLGEIHRGISLIYTAGGSIRVRLSR